LRVFVKRAKAFVVTADHHFDLSTQLDAVSLEQKLIDTPPQLSLFSPEVSALSGQL
jgi:hypothetical protein